MAARALKRGVVGSRSGSPLSSPSSPQAVVRIFPPTSFSPHRRAPECLCCECVHNPKSEKSPQRKGHSHFLMHQKSRIRAGRAKRWGQGCARERRLIPPSLTLPPPLLLSPCSCFPVFISIFLREVVGYAYLPVLSPPLPHHAPPSRCNHFSFPFIEPAVFFFLLVFA